LLINELVVLRRF